ncbi:Pentatricopeptide repeat-containing protein [Quillaja saponaria]|uniref:Pentatricopeptide repeat-containing protein n=1 Tax=Quillaja saponaria TaxID=32244 RepID=A0AAD7KU72_QUISA|nr:Pentatricopeptide repeat-containing protein [Quillaja saponaria]
MAEKLALPLLLPNPPPKPLFSNHNLCLPTVPSAPPIYPILQDLILNQNPNSPQPHNPPSPTNFPSPITRARTRIGKYGDPNRGRPWFHHRLSAQGQQILQTLIDPSFDSNQLNEILLQFVDESQKGESFSRESLSSNFLAIIKGLGFNKKSDLALGVFDWVRNRKDCALLLNGSMVAVVVNILGKAGQVSAAASLLHNLRIDGVELDVYAYTSLITACASNGRYREAVTVFDKMEEEGCKPTLITYNVILNVYGKMGMPWNKIRAVVEGMKSDGVAPDLYTYNTLISCCRRGSLYKEAVEVFEEMKLKGFTPDKVTYNSLLDCLWEV